MTESKKRKTPAKKKSDKKVVDLKGIRAFVRDVYAAIHGEASNVVATVHGHKMHSLTAMKEIPGAMLSLLFIILDNHIKVQSNNNRTLMMNQQAISRHQLEMDKNSAVLIHLIYKEHGPEVLQDLLGQLQASIGAAKLIQFIVDRSWVEDVPSPDEIPEVMQEVLEGKDGLIHPVAPGDRPSHPEGSTFFGGDYKGESR